MKQTDNESHESQHQEKQLQGVAIESVLEKRRLDQALNAKEFAVCAGVSYSTARGWFHMPGFPAFRGVVFWQDFVRWRAEQHAFKSQALSQPSTNAIATPSNLPPRAAQILFDV